MDNSEKLKALDAAISKIEKDFGKGAIMKLGDKSKNMDVSCVASDLRSLTDSQGELEGFYLSLALDGLDCSPLELAELCEEVTKQDVIDVANSVECDMIYFLKGSGSDEDEDEDDDAEA